MEEDPDVRTRALARATPYIIQTIHVCIMRILHVICLCEEVNRPEVPSHLSEQRPDQDNDDSDEHDDFEVLICG